MSGTSVSCVTFLVLLHLLFCLNPSVASDLQHCQPINQTVSVEKEGCPTCLVVETSICSGHCLTQEPIKSQESGVRRGPYKRVSQHVCTYRDVHYQTVRLPDCPPNVDPFVTFPVALSCECNMCTMDTSDCTIESLKPDFCMTQTAFEPAYY